MMMLAQTALIAITVSQVAFGLDLAPHIPDNEAVISTIFGAESNNPSASESPQKQQKARVQQTPNPQAQ